MATKKKTTAKKKPSATKKAAPAKKAAKKAVGKKTAVKKTAAKKAAAKKPAKKAPAKKAPAKKTVKKAPAKKAVAVKAPAKKAASKKAKTGKKTTRSATPLSDKAKALLTSKAEREKNATPILFSLEDAQAAIAARKAESESKEPEKPAPAKAPRKAAAKVAKPAAKPAAKQVHGAASLADILGFDPAKKKPETELEESAVPAKWKKYYRLLIDLRQHVKDELDLHTADTLKHSSREDSGDLSGYGIHQADAGTDSFDRDFALSLVSSEQDALNEIEQAIQRIRDGSYGVCEVTGKKIDAKRLAAVPFTRFSVEGQSEYEKNKRRKTDRGASTAFAESGDLPALSSDDGDE